MGNFIGKIKSNLRQYRILLIVLVLLTVLAIVLGVIFALNKPSDVYEVNLSDIAYIKFLSGKSGLMSMMFKMWLSLLIFLILIIFCGVRRFLFPLGVVFYLYLVYSQAFVLMNIVFLYGFFSCLILLMLLIIYTLLNAWFFICVLVELWRIGGKQNYLRNMCKPSCSFVLIYELLIMLLCALFCLVLLILKSFIILLIF